MTSNSIGVSIQFIRYMLALRFSSDIDELKETVCSEFGMYDGVSNTVSGEYCPTILGGSLLTRTNKGKELPQLDEYGDICSCSLEDREPEVETITEDLSDCKVVDNFSDGTIHPHLLENKLDDDEKLKL